LKTNGTKLWRYRKRKRIYTKGINNVHKLVLGEINGMPDHIEKEMTKIMKDFIWDRYKRGLMRLDYMAKIREKGGLGMLDLKARMKAKDIMWLRKYLETPDKIPT